MKLSKSLVSELFNIGNNMPVFAGNVESHQSAQALINIGLAMRYEGQYVLTEKGKKELLRIKIEGAKLLANKSVVNQWAKPQKAIALTHGAVAHVDEDCPQETIDALNKMVEHVHNLKPEEWEKIKRKSRERRTQIETRKKII